MFLVVSISTRDHTDVQAGKSSHIAWVFYGVLNVVAAIVDS